ncbi:Inner membrane transport protein YdhP [compost metagenome]
MGSTIATGLVAKEKAASAIAIMFSGLTVALVTGVPLGTWIGQVFGWRETFLVVSALGVIAMAGSLLLIPNNLPKGAASSLREQLSVLTHKPLLMVYAKTALGYGGAFTAFTFLAPILQQVSGFGANAVSLILLVYGVSVAVGNIWGGKLADKMGPLPALKLMFGGLALILLMLTFTAPHPVLAVLTVLVWGAFAFGNVPGLQVLVVKQAEIHTPNAVDVASGLNIAAFNVGIALGSVVGGFVVEHLGLMHTPWIGALIVLLAYGLTHVSEKREAKLALAV